MGDGREVIIGWVEEEKGGGYRELGRVLGDGKMKGLIGEEGGRRGDMKLGLKFVGYDMFYSRMIGGCYL